MSSFLLQTSAAFTPLLKSMLLIGLLLLMIYFLAVLAPKIARFLEKIFPRLAQDRRPPSDGQNNITSNPKTSEEDTASSDQIHDASCTDHDTKEGK